MAKTDLSAVRLRELLNYDPETGTFTWRTTRGKIKAGTTAGTVNVQGYTQISVFGRARKAHRLAWLYVYGCEPSRGIDHINRIKTDNRICNMRLASDMENGQNRNVQCNNLSGATGVSYFGRNKKWRSTIRHAGRQHHLGFFETVREAADAYAQAKLKLHTFNPVAVEGLAVQAGGHASDALTLLEAWPAAAPKSCRGVE